MPRRRPTFSPIMGQSLKRHIPFAQRRVTSLVILLLAAAAIAVSAPDSAPPSRAAPLVQARAAVRIVAGARISFAPQPGREVPRFRPAQIRTADGRQPAQLIEFE